MASRSLRAAAGAPTAHHSSQPATTPAPAPAPSTHLHDVQVLAGRHALLVEPQPLLHLGGEKGGAGEGVLGWSGWGWRRVASQPQQAAWRLARASFCARARRACAACRLSARLALQVLAERVGAGLQASSATPCAPPLPGPRASPRTWSLSFLPNASVLASRKQSMREAMEHLLAR